MDVGDRRIGLAVSDAQGSIARPLDIIERRDDDQAISEIENLIGVHDVGTVVVGIPYLMDGTVGHQGEKIRLFVAKLAERVTVPIEYRDESLTTSRARSLMKVTRGKKKRRTEKDDAIAAAWLLQEYLDEKQNRLTRHNSDLMSTDEIQPD
jgi:putative Holliday junction resolvase